uniref:Uncharacterized protein n=1 Tax=Lygus hesperus TaxID=30085 RepID=A0A146LK16_LYGHE
MGFPKGMVVQVVVLGRGHPQGGGMVGMGAEASPQGEISIGKPHPQPGKLLKDGKLQQDGRPEQQLRGHPQGGRGTDGKEVQQVVLGHPHGAGYCVQHVVLGPGQPQPNPEGYKFQAPRPHSAAEVWTATNEAIPNITKIVLMVVATTISNGNLPPYSGEKDILYNQEVRGCCTRPDTYFLEDHVPLTNGSHSSRFPRLLPFSQTGLIS